MGNINPVERSLPICVIDIQHSSFPAAALKSRTHVRTLLRKNQCNRFADPAACTGDNHYFFVETERDMLKNTI